jgi:hypothetical protein
MFRRTALLSVPALALVLAMSTAIRAADDPLKIVPSSALGWAVVNHLADGDAKIQQLAGIVSAPQVSLLDMAKNNLGAKNGLNTKGAAGVIAMPPKDKDDADAQPAVVLFIAVTDYVAFLGNFEAEKKGGKITEVQINGQDLVMARLGSYALVAKSDDRSALESVLASKQNVADEAKSFQTWLAGNDVSLVATKAGVKVMAAKGKAALKQFGESLSALGEQGAAAKSGLNMYVSFLDAAEKNVALAGLGLQVDKAGNVRLATRAKIIAGGDFDSALAEIKPGRGNLLAGVPGGGFVFAGGGELQGSLTRMLLGMSATMMKKSPEIYGISAEQADKLGELSVQAFKSVHSASMVMKGGKKGEPIYSNLYVSMGVDDADQFLAAYEKQIEAMKDILKDVKEGMLQAPVLKKIEIGGKPALEVEITMPVAKMAGNPMAEKMMDAMFGPDHKSTMCLLKADEKTVYMGFGVSPEKLPRAIALVKDIKKSLAGDAEAAATIALLPPGAQGVVLISPRGYMGMVQRMMEIMIGENGPQISLPQFPKSPPVGVAIQAAPSELSVSVVFPAETIKAAGEYVSEARQKALNGLQPQSP